MQGGMLAMNRPAAYGSDSTYVAESAPRVLIMLSANPSGIAVNPELNPKPGYSSRDLAPVTNVSSSRSPGRSSFNF
jgi:tripartite-type tricarboxylate transporter receptor subunit TctC